VTRQGKRRLAAVLVLCSIIPIFALIGVVLPPHLVAPACFVLLIAGATVCHHLDGKERP